MSELRRQPEANLASEAFEDRRAEKTPGESESHFGQLFNGASDAVFVHEADGRIVDVNQAACASLGYTREELLRMTVAEVEMAQQPADLAALWARVDAGQPATVEGMHRRRDGSTFPVEVHIAPLAWGKRPLFFAAAHDISTRKREERITQARLQLLEFSLNHSLADLLVATLDEAEALTGSQVGFYRFFEPDHESLSLRTWSTRTTREMCRAAAAGRHDGLREADVWVDCIRQRQPVVHNDCAAQLHRQGSSPNPVSIKREMAAPVFRGDHIVAVLGVGNKATDYDLHDSASLMRLADLAWDIAERKRAEDALRIGEYRHQIILQTAMDGFWCVDAEGRLLDVNDAYCRMSGYERETLLTMRITDLEVVETPADVAARLRQIQSVGQDRFETKHRRKDGSVYDVEVSAQHQAQTGAHTFAFLRDITERKHAQTKLAESERKFANILHFTPVSMAITSLDDGKYVDVNDAFVSLMGYTREEVIGRTALDLDIWVEPERRAFLRAEVIRAGEIHGAPMQVRSKSGRIIDGLFSGAQIRIGGVPHLISQVVDITDQKHTTEALRKSERRLSLAISATADAIWEWNLITNQTYYSPRWYEILGYPAGTFSMNFEAWKSLCHPDDVQPAMERIAAAINVVQNSGYQVEFRMRHADGSWRWILGRGNVVERNPAGQPTLLSGTNTDITERKRAEEILQRYELLARHTRDIILFIRFEDLRIIDANAAAVAAYGYTLDELREITLDQIRTREDRDRARAQINQASADGLRYETVHCRKDGSTFPVEVSSRGMTIGTERIVMGIIRDISERQRAEELARRHQSQLAHLSRVTSVGEMASGLAHELNQPLTAILNYAALCADQLDHNMPRPELMHQALHGLADEAERAAQIIRRLRAFIRKQELQRGPANITAVIREGIGLLTYELRRTAVCPVEQFADNLPQVNLDAVQIQQVMVNLIQNALDAMAKTPRQRRRLIVRVRAAEPPFIQVEVEDSGSGLPTEIRERIFEPFVTTKPNGLGLGLAISRSIIESHGGRLEVHENVTGGSTFRFTLPTVER